MGLTLDLSGLTKAHGEFDLGPIDLTVDEGVLAVLGPSGSGKTTLLSVIAGTATPDAGAVRLGGRNLVGRPPEARRVGMVFQEGALFPHMTARENVEYAASADGRVEEFATMLELDDVLDRRPPTLSGGERRRVALARTLAADPDVLLLDEPLSSLDAPIRRRLRDELHDLFASLDVPILYVTHDQRTATALGDRLAILRDGALEQVGPPEAVIRRPASRFVARFTGTENLFDGRIVDRTDDGVQVQCDLGLLQSGVSTGQPSAVTVCVHPSRVEVQARDAAGEPGTANAVSGTVARYLNVGNEYRVDVAVDGRSATLSTAVRPTTFERLEIDAGTELDVQIPRSAIHLIPEPPVETRNPPGEH